MSIVPFVSHVSSPSVGHSVSYSVAKSLSRRVTCFGRLVARSISFSVARSLNRSVSRWVVRSRGRSVAQSLDQSVGRSVTQSVNESCNRWPAIGRSFNTRYSHACERLMWSGVSISKHKADLKTGAAILVKYNCTGVLLLLDTI